MQPKELVEMTQNLLIEKKAEDIAVIDLTNQGYIVDYMIIASGTSSRHVNTIVDYAAHELKTQGIKSTIEGVPVCDWALLDLGDVLVHVFRPEIREFYNLEKMWGTHFTNVN